jgi:hypothetical protein
LHWNLRSRPSVAPPALGSFADFDTERLLTRWASFLRAFGAVIGIEAKNGGVKPLLQKKPREKNGSEDPPLQNGGFDRAGTGLFN